MIEERGPGTASAPDALGGAGTALLEALPFGVMLVESPGIVLWANPTFWELSGRNPSIVGQNFLQILERETLSGRGGPNNTDIQGAIRDSLDHGSSTLIPSVIPAHPRPDRRYVLDVQFLPLAVGPGALPRSLVVATSVNEQFEERVRARVFYRAFLTCTIPLFILDEGATFLDVNPALEKAFGYSREECLGQSFDLIRAAAGQHPAIAAPFWTELQDPSIGHWSGEEMYRDRAGREHSVLVAMSASRDDRGGPPHFLGVALDQTERKAYEQSVAHADRLVSIGRLAAGVAHEVNTPLANISLVAESLGRRSTDPWVRARAGTISEQVQAASKIVRGLLDFSRRSGALVAPVDARDVVRGALELFHAKQAETVELEVTGDDQPLLISGDRAQLVQVVTNLLNNAHDAMHGSGRIRVALQAEPGRAILEITDSGPGIPPEILPHIFEPFFTTKPEGEGTGLGLAICHGIIADHRGEIVASNVPGIGARFRISLPLLPGHLAPMADAPRAS